MSQKPKPLPPLYLLRDVLVYDPETGDLTWKHRCDRNKAWNTRFAGKKAGYKYKNTRQGHYQGYVVGISIGGVSSLYQAHRIAWKIYTGDEPPAEIDHINGDSGDNRWENLRNGELNKNATNRKKYRCNTSGVTGVSRHGGKWRARVRVKNRVRNSLRKIGFS